MGSVGGDRIMNDGKGQSYPPGSDIKIIRPDGTIEWIESKKKYVKNYGEVKFSEGKE
jgi:hypothetical protein